jgi:hypothetical protein
MPTETLVINTNNLTIVCTALAGNLNQHSMQFSLLAKFKIGKKLWDYLFLNMS